MMKRMEWRIGNGEQQVDSHSCSLLTTSLHPQIKETAMTNLPITSNASQSANAAGTTKGNNAAADPAADAQAAEPFASLLARKISGSISPGTGIAQIAIAAGVIAPE